MRLIVISYAILTCGFAWTPVTAHKDRIEKPKTYRFTFRGGQTVTLDNAENSPLATYCNDIVDGKRKLVKAELTFSTGERLTFEGNGDRWTKIQVSDAKIELMVPEQTIKKIPVIHFASVALLWDGRDEKAFTASYFYIQFDIGTDKFFNEYPELNLSFSAKEFSNETVWRQTSKNSRQWADF